MKIEKMKRVLAIIYLLLPMFFLSVGLNAQNIAVKGKVLDPDGNALPGTAITIQGTSVGTVTSDEGDYSLANVPAGSTLVFQLVGYVTQEIKVDASKTLYNVILLEESVSLEDVTVVAFSTQKRESVMASISTIKPSELKIPSSNLTTAFAGRIAGLISYQLSGEPGQDNASFFIRGVTSFGIGKKDPLILIDGVEMTTDDLARLTTDDINSFSVMKDANATALYGARGANGVILVTTKEGREGKVKIQFRAESSLSAPTRMIDIADPLTFMKLNNEAVRSRSFMESMSTTTYYSQEEIWARERGLDPERYPMVDWMNLLFKDNTINHRYNLNVSGGGTVVRYYVAASFARDNGIINMDERNNFNNNIAINKYALRSNININLTKTTELIARLNGSFDNYSGPLDGGAELFNKARNANPVRFLPYYEPDAANSLTKHIMFGNSREGRINSKWYLNPYADMVKGYKTSDRSSMSTQFELRQDLKFITEGLSARALYNLNRFSNLEARRAYDPHFYNLDPLVLDRRELVFLNASENPEAYLKQSGGTSSVQQSMYFETAVQYSREFNKKHAVSGLLVYTMREYEDTGQALGSDVPKSLPYRNLGLSGRVTYGYDSRYFVELNFGYNGSERFSENERFGFFPSVGVGYLISNEEFMQPYKDVLSKLKFKATYGLVGNDQIGDGSDRFFYLSNVNTSAGGGSYLTYRFGREAVVGNTSSGNGIEFLKYGDPYITWEISRKTNFGVEINLWKSLEIQLDYATDYKSNILQDRIVPSTMGLNSKLVPRANVGEASGRSFEVMVDYSKTFGKDFWTVFRGTFTYASNKFEVVEEIDYLAGPRRSQVGQKLSQTYGYIAERLFLDDYEVENSPSQTALGYAMAGDIKYKDINGDNVIDNNDQVPIGYPSVPEINYGFGISAGYKNIDFSCFFSGQARSSFWIDPKATAPFINDMGDGVTATRALLQYWADSHWDESNRNIYALWPRLSDAEVKNNTVTSTWFMRSGDILRLKSLEIGYTLPKKFVNIAGMQNVRFYASGTNLFGISKFKMWDPEMGNNGLAYPLQRVFNLGVTVEF
jgi:TonB-linked SusC/RagA family outer membrane protein